MLRAGRTKLEAMRNDENGLGWLQPCLRTGLDELSFHSPSCSFAPLAASISTISLLSLLDAAAIAEPCQPG